MNLQRLDKIIASQFNISRTDTKARIKRGQATVNGEVVRDPAFSVCPEKDLITFGGKAVVFKKFVYIVMNKPKGVLSASNDKNRQTVVDLVPFELRRPNICPVGRLDKDTTGLLILTDDGQFAHKVISPKSDIKKVYEVTLDGEIPPDAIDKFADGLILHDGTKCLPAGLEIINGNIARVEIREGKYHQIKRMFGVIDLGVNELKRLSIGDFKLPPDLKEGECREMTEGEIKMIFPDCLNN